MASAGNTVRLSARLASRYVPRCSQRRGFRISSRQRAAQNYTMPALSPTMIEGNIAAWRVKEGDSFSAGDVILEIETDKATMDVEAQDDGILFKITQPDGAKGVKVGSRIAVLAEEGDDLGRLQMPAEDGQSASSSSESKEVESKKEERKTDSALPAKEDSATGGSKEISSDVSEPEKMVKPYAESQPAQPTKMRGYNYPLYPSVQQLLHENGYSAEEAKKITATGPNGRLLKGDVLAYLGQIDKDYPAKIAQKLEKLGHLDLTHIVAAQPTQIEPAKAEAPAAQKEIEIPSETEVAVPISLSAVIATQKRVQDSLGIFLPLSTFIARASELANADLPARKRSSPSSDELFNAVLGLDRVSTKTSRGRFFPSITSLAPPPMVSAPRPQKKKDIIDFLSAPRGAKQSAEPPLRQVAAALGISAGDNVFSVVAKNGEEKRAEEYLEKMKLVLEEEPGRLIL